MSADQSSSVADSQHDEQQLSSSSGTIEPSEPPMSKRKLKRQAKAELLRTKYKEQKLASKQRRKERRKEINATIDRLKAECKDEEAQQIIDELRARRIGLNGKGKQAREENRRRLENARDVPGAAPIVVIDCSFEALMADKDMTALGNQVRFSYSLNFRARSPVNYVVSSFTPALRAKLDPEHVKWVMSFDDRHFCEIFADRRQNIVYLTAESDNVLDTLNSDEIYVIGGLVDHNRYRSHCHDLAVSSKIRTARLPISEFMESQNDSSVTRRVITVNQVFQILMEYNHYRDWAKALSIAMPPRKHFVLKSNGQSQTPASEISPFHVSSSECYDSIVASTSSAAYDIDPEDENELSIAARELQVEASSSDSDPESDKEAQL